MADVKFVATVDSTGAVKAIETLDQAFAKLKGETKDTGNATVDLGHKSESLWRQFAMGQVVFDLTRRGLGLVKRELIDSIKESADYEKAVKGLNSAFALSGRTMPGMVEHLRRYGTELQNLGLEEDDVIIKAESLLLQLTNLDEKGIKAATRGAIGLSSVFGMDLFSATEMVAKGMEGNYLMLNRLIPSIRNATTEEGKRAEMMKTFEGLYARAIADTQTYAGQVKQLGLEWKEAKQAMGDAILSTGILQGAMEGLSQLMKRMSGGEARAFADVQRDYVERQKEAHDVLMEASMAMGISTERLWDLTEAYYGNFETTLQWIKSGAEGTKAQKALEVAIKAHNAEVVAAGAAYSETGPKATALAAKVTILNTAIDAMPWGKHRAELLAAEAWLRSTATLIEGQIPAVAGYSSNVDEAARHVAMLRAELQRLNAVPQSWQDKLGKAMEKVALIESTIMGQADAVFSQAQRNKEIAIDNEYKKRLAVINATIKDEDKKQKAIMALEAEFQIKKTAAQAAGAKQQKAIALAGAIMNTAEAISAMLTMKPAGPWNFVFAAMAGALGAIQVGLIAKQPIPLAKGAVFSKPTLLPARTYEVGEAGEREIVAPESVIVGAVTKVMDRIFPFPQMAFAGAGGGVNVTIHGPLITTTGLSRREIHEAGELLAAEVTHQLGHRFGR